MSWLADIAGKAEEILNRVDKSAAGALQRPKSNIHSENAAMDIPFVQPEILPRKFPTTTSYASSPVVKTGSSTGTLSQSSIKRPVANEDEILLEFLNSADTVKPVKKISHAKEKVEVKIPLKVENELTSEDSPFSTTVDEEVVCLQENQQSSENSSVEATEINQDERVIEVVQENEPARDVTNVSTDTCATVADVDNSRIRQLENENRLLRNEVTSLSQELGNVNHRCRESEGEIRRLQKKSEHWNSQVSNSDHLIRELRDKESDLAQALDAKDSQLAVLRVRIQETDQELMVQRTLLETLRNENEKLLKDLGDSNSLYHKTVESLQEKIQETDLTFRHEQEARKLADVESFQRFSKLEDEQKSLMETLTSVQKRYTDEKALTKDHASQLKNLQVALDIAKQDLAEYRQKAQRILQSKEKLISTLRESREDSEETTPAAVETAELEDLRQERDTLKEELQRTNCTLAVLRSDLREVEQGNQVESENLRRQAASLEQQFRQAVQRNNELEVEFNQQKEELRYVREDLTRTKSNLHMRIKDRDDELEKLRKQLTTKQVTCSSQSELESRIRALTENLIQKQTLVEALSTEKNSLVMQLERMEQKMKDSQIVNSRSPIHVGITVADDDMKNRLPTMAESPYDNVVTRKVKRAYGLVDGFSVRLGLFLRHYPIARLFVIFYMILLHLWVMVVLLTYQPEVHGSQKLGRKTGPK